MSLASWNSPAHSPAASDEDRYLTLAELARYSGLSVRQLQRFIAANDHPLPAYHIGKAVRVRKSEYDRWLKERQTTRGADDWTDDDRRIALELRGYPVERR